MAEVEKALTDTGRLTTEQIDRAIRRLREADEGAVVSGYESLVPVMTCHPDDRHVLSVAVHSGAEVIVTWNASDFPPEACEPYAIQIQSPDEFLSNLWDQKPHTMLDVLAETASYYDAVQAGREV